MGRFFFLLFNCCKDSRDPIANLLRTQFACSHACTHNTHSTIFGYLRFGNRFYYFLILDHFISYLLVCEWLSSAILRVIFSLIIKKGQAKSRGYRAKAEHQFFVCVFGVYCIYNKILLPFGVWWFCCCCCCYFFWCVNSPNGTLIIISTWHNSAQRSDATLFLFFFFFFCGVCVYLSPGISRHSLVNKIHVYTDVNWAISFIKCLCRLLRLLLSL